MRRLLVSTLICSISIVLYFHSINSSLDNITTTFRSLLWTTARRTNSAMSSTPNRAYFPGLPVVPPNDPSLTSNATVPRAVRMHFLAGEQAEGQGARVRRSIGTPKLRNLSPFLMLDHFSVSPGAGFPDHPHRGQETITYLLEGAVDHEDFAGNRGTIWPGDLQFMTAGRGIVHAEIPRHGEDARPVVGMQLWVDVRIPRSPLPHVCAERLLTP